LEEKYRNPQSKEKTALCLFGMKETGVPFLWFTVSYMISQENKNLLLSLVFSPSGKA